MEKKSKQVFLDAMRGFPMNRQMEDADECPHCKGYGQVEEGKYKSVCGECLGWGYLPPGFEGYATQRSHLKEEWESHLVMLSKQNFPGRIAAVIEALKPDPPREALLYAADGWWPHNFGGNVREIGDNKWSVEVYTD